MVDSRLSLKFAEQNRHFAKAIALRLLEEINLDDADAARVVLSTDLRGVLAGLNRGDERCFKVVTRLQAYCL